MLPRGACGRKLKQNRAWEDDFFFAAALYLRWFFQWLVLRKPAFSWKNHTVLVGVPGSFEVFFLFAGTCSGPDGFGSGRVGRYVFFF